GQSGFWPNLVRRGGLATDDVVSRRNSSCPTELGRSHGGDVGEAGLGSWIGRSQARSQRLGARLSRREGDHIHTARTTTVARGAFVHGRQRERVTANKAGSSAPRQTSPGKREASRV